VSPSFPASHLETVPSMPSFHLPRPFFASAADHGPAQPPRPRAFVSFFAGLLPGVNADTRVPQMTIAQIVFDNERSFGLSEDEILGKVRPSLALRSRSPDAYPHPRSSAASGPSWTTASARACTRPSRRCPAACACAAGRRCSTADSCAGASAPLALFYLSPASPYSYLVRLIGYPVTRHRPTPHPIYDI
jgi:hypothetical protein